MKIFTLIFAIVLIQHCSILAENLSKIAVESFIKALVTNSNNLPSFFDSTEVALSHRLGISYEGIQFKELISNDIDPEVKKRILNKNFYYTFKIDSLDNNFSVLTISVDKVNREYQYFFKNGKMISKTSYFARNWTKIESDFFIFHVSNKSHINNYSIKRLDQFVSNMMILLDLNETEIERLKKQKIHYFLCDTESEIKSLTGFNARGIYDLSSDFIISTFTTHYHEICHLLINYKLQSLELYTLPFLQEGFAVAFGGRGGKEPEIILEMGKFLYQSEFIDYTNLLNQTDFMQFDASMSYPAAGLYVKFIVDKSGIEKFLELYNKFSSSQAEISNQNISLEDLPSDNDWQDYLKYYDQQKIQITNINEKAFSDTICFNNDFKIFSNKNTYLFKLNGSLAILSNKNFKGYNSALFNELFENKKYQNEKYIVSVNKSEVSIYNLFTNNLIAKYVQGFSINGFPVKNKNGFFLFIVSKSLFDQELDHYIIRKIDTE